MKILGMDTSCDDTSAAVVEDGRRILSNIVSSQEAVHVRFAGVVPELASRKHIEMIWPVTAEALEKAGTSLSGVDAIAVCMGPGLIGSLLAGCSFAKALAYANGKPLIAVNHLEGHIHANFLEPEPPEFPFLALVVSGGHTSMYHAVSPGRYIEVARTLDDAAGEAYDKVAKILGAGFPGGPLIDRLAREGNPKRAVMPRPMRGDRRDFSFSGLKTAVMNFHRDNPGVPIRDIAAGFQESVVDVLVTKTIREAKRMGLAAIAISGGVAANSRLREQFADESRRAGLRLSLPSIELCTDNAAMIAAAAHHHFMDGDFASLDLNPAAYLPLGLPTP